MSKTSREPAKPSKRNSADSLVPAKPSVQLPNKLKVNLRAGRESVHQSRPRNVTTN
jgi:hypothetical protein